MPGKGQKHRRTELGRGVPERERYQPLKLPFSLGLLLGIEFAFILALRGKCVSLFKLLTCFACGRQGTNQIAYCGVLGAVADEDHMVVTIQFNYESAGPTFKHVSRTKAMSRLMLKK